jgi:surfeit locus 1 family protein
MLRRMIFPLVLGIVGCAILIGLGVWQMQRLAWKEALLARIDAMIVDAPVPLMAQPDPATDAYRPVQVTGRFTGETVEVLQGVVGTSPGVRIIEAFQTADGRRVLIDRGFLPETARGTPRPPHAATVTGNLLWPDETDSFTPPPDPKSGLWFARDAAAMAARLATETTLIVAREPTGDGITPMPVDTSAIPTDHEGYAITWFLLAAVWAVMTGYLLWRIRQRTV